MMSYDKYYKVIPNAREQSLQIDPKRGLNAATLVSSKELIKEYMFRYFYGLNTLSFVGFTTDSLTVWLSSNVFSLAALAALLA